MTDDLTQPGEFDGAEDVIEEPFVPPTVIVVATHNAHKIDEIGRTLLPLLGKPVELRPTTGKAPKEDGTTFVENALIKARAAFAETGLPSIADDSGLCVDALDGDPGIHSSRYTDEGTDEANRSAVIEMMKGVKNRSAHFVCAIAFVSSEGERTEVGEWHGVIRPTEKGANGFGYDPIFAPNGVPGTAAELSPTEKAALSHRARAIGNIAPAINRYLNDHAAS